MSEMHLPENSEPRATPPTPERDGSLVRGFALAWLIVVVGYVGLFALLWAINSVFSPAGVAFVGLLITIAPLAAAIATAIWLLSRNRRRTALGIFVGLGSMFAVGILLVAACFGLMVSSWGH